MLNVYSIKDIKVGTHNRPFFQSHDQEALRAFEQIVEDPQSTINKYPSDFELWRLGSFDQENGTFTTEQGCLCNGLAFKKEEQDAVQESLPLSKKA